MSAAPAKSRDLWSLVLDAGWIDSTDLLTALEAEAIKPQPDFRTRVLLRDSYLALSKRWGDDLLHKKISPEVVTLIAPTFNEDLGDRGFSTLEHRLVERTRSETIEQLFRELGLAVREPCQLTVGGSCGLILPGILVRQTDDIDAVNQVPAAIRTHYELVENLVKRHGLRLAHFQSHYLPDSWESRVHSHGVYGHLQVFLVDPADILLGKLFSRREKDLDDLRITLPIIGKNVFRERFHIAANSLLAHAPSKQNAQHNWYILFGEELPTL